MIQAVLFDFGQTLVDSAEGFRKAEREGQARIFADLGVESWPEFLANYRRLRQDFHARSEFCRTALWQRVYSLYDRQPTPEFLLEAERDYWETVKSQTTPFPEATSVLVRLAFVLLALFKGIGLVVYLILLFLMPLDSQVTGER